MRCPARCAADGRSGFFSYAAWKCLHVKHKLLIRVVNHDGPQAVSTVVGRIVSGQDLSAVGYRKYDRRGIVVRVIEYTLDDPQRTGHGEVHRLMTNLFDETVYPALELIEWYHDGGSKKLFMTNKRRIKIPVRAEKTTHLRSDTPDGLRQELYALSLGHYVIRAMMLQAAEAIQLDADRLSFTGCFQILQTRLPECDPARPNPTFADWFEAVLWEISCETIPVRRTRINPRVIKRKMSKWLKKRPEHRQRELLRKSFAETVVMKT